jgi:ankyrin repeat protein
MRIHIALLALLPASLVSAATPGPFYTAIRNNDLPRLRELLLDRGPNARDERGNSALMYAAGLGNAESMQMVLAAGGDPNLANNLSATPLMWCAGDAVKVRLLLEKGAKVNVRSRLGRTPLEIAAAWEGSLEAVRLLIDKGADVNAADEGGGSVLAQAAFTNNLEVARLLIAKGAKVNTVDLGGFTPLHNAAGNGNTSAPLVKLLLEHGAKVNVVSGDTAEVVKNGPLALGHLTPLHTAAQNGNLEAVEALVKAGADVNAKDVRNVNPLVFAVATDHPNPKVVQLLLAKGAVREPAVEWARRYQNPAILAQFGLHASPLAVAGGDSLKRTPREAMAKALSVSQPTAAKFLGNGGCPSCHAQYLNGLAVAAAKASGVKTDAALEAADTRATLSMRGIFQEQLFQVMDTADGVEGFGFSLMQLAAGGAPASLQIDSMIHHLAAMQRHDGDWQFFEGRPPLEGSLFGPTARAIRALSLYPIPARKAEIDARIGRAAAWLEKGEPLNTEDRSTQILGLAWAGNKVPAGRVKELIALQHADGGWGQTEHLPSDAWATGQVLWALHEAGTTGADPIYRRAVDYLLRTQKEDGTWHVVSRSFGFQPYFQSGFPYDHDQWISQAGTAMATIGLSYAVK